MYKLCKIEKSASRQRKVENMLAEMMEKQEFSKIKVSELCERAEIPRKSFYVYFDAKEDVLQALLEHTIYDLDSYYLPNQDHAKTYTFRELERFFSFWKEKERILSGLLKSDLSGILVTKVIEHSIEDEKRIPFMCWSDDKMASETALIYSVSGLMTIVLQWHKSGYRETIPQMAQKATELLTSGCFKNV